MLIGSALLTIIIVILFISFFRRCHEEEKRRQRWLKNNPYFNNGCYASPRDRGSRFFTSPVFIMPLNITPTGAVSF